MSLGAMYPVRVDATLDPRLSRWLWILKWLLAIPHYVVLAFLWIAFVVVSVVAFFAILFTGRYPYALFEFNVGVLRWSWRVAYYSYGALGTDRYPPFTLSEVPDYPAHFDVEYPDHLSRGLVLVKWWLLAIPQYLVVAVFAGGGAWLVGQADRSAATWGPGGLIGLLVLIAAVALAVSGRYPQQIFDFVLGLNRWVLRVAAYASLMTDQYPPFRLDMGGHEAQGTVTLGNPGPPSGPGEMRAAPPGGPGPVGVVVPPPATQWAPQGAYAPPPPPGSSTPAPQWAPRSGWTPLRVVSLVVGCLLAVVSIGLLAAGGAATWLDNTQRDAAGYLTSDAHTFSTSSYAITSDRIDLGTSDVAAPAGILGTVRIRATASNPLRPIFIGIAPQAQADSYLTGVGHAVVTDWANGTANYRQESGGPPPTVPTAISIWAASVSGAGTQTLTWKPTGGNWVVVVMNLDARPRVSVTADAAATVPALGWISGGLFAAGGVLLIVAVLLIIMPIVRASRRPPAMGPPAMGPPAVMQPPVAQPPAVMQPPVAQPPATEPPATEPPPSAQPPVAEPPTIEPGSTD